jgi:segregation and condensation protein A
MIDATMTDSTDIPTITASEAEEPAGQPYQVTLPVFEGPLDLLLHLIEREELDITAISLVQVTDQYLAHIERLKEIDADALADFLVMAARLILIKSRALLPRPPALPGEEEEEDPGEQLARQLREYRRFKAVAAQLDQISEQGRRAFVRVAAPPKIQSKIDLEGVTLDSLLEAVRQALEVLPPGPPVNGVVPRFTITIGDRVNLILTRTEAGHRFSFRSLLEDSLSRGEIIVSFLAILELLKRRRIVVKQEVMFGEIWIEAAPDTPDLTDDADYDDWGEEFEPYRESEYHDAAPDEETDAR